MTSSCNSVYFLKHQALQKKKKKSYICMDAVPYAVYFAIEEVNMLLFFYGWGFPTAPECARVDRKFSRLLVSCVPFARRPTCQQLSPCPWLRAHDFIRTQQLSKHGRKESVRMETSLCKTVCLFPDFGKKFGRHARRLNPGSVLALQLLQVSLITRRNSR